MRRCQRTVRGEDRPVETDELEVQERAQVNGGRGRITQRKLIAQYDEEAAESKKD